MPNINRITINTNGDYTNLYTKRTCSDNSELYITSKLNKLYEQTIMNKSLFSSRRNLKKLVEGNHLDETI